MLTSRYLLSSLISCFSCMPRMSSIIIARDTFFLTYMLQPHVYRYATSNRLIVCAALLGRVYREGNADNSKAREYIHEYGT